MCDWTCYALGLMDIIMVFSIIFYCVVLVVVVKKKVFSVSFTISLIPLGVLDIACGLSGRLYYIFRLRNWFRFVRHFHFADVGSNGHLYPKISHRWFALNASNTVEYLHSFRFWPNYKS